jgi:hypothetical protein
LVIPSPSSKDKPNPLKPLQTKPSHIKTQTPSKPKLSPLKLIPNLNPLSSTTNLHLFFPLKIPKSPLLKFKCFTQNHQWLPKEKEKLQMLKVLQ